ncbi:MAG TPA: D-Ala-D-Ala carboxypeptidase family metallohydrolase [Bryobacteraceae bacterium]|nr:D-Ala-D-Ala carboxypeptidase family metallohydrolase [Bryobacteraceae bacterium]
MESTHFKVAELRCHHCGREGVRRELLDVLESLRARAGPIRVNSAYRCPQHPVEVRKPKPGYHARGIAADLVPLGVPLRGFYEIVREEPRVKGIGVDHAARYIHVDVRESATPVLWVYHDGMPMTTADPFREVVNA